MKTDTKAAIENVNNQLRALRNKGIPVIQFVCTECGNMEFPCKFSYDGWFEGQKIVTAEDLNRFQCPFDGTEAKFRVENG